MCLQCRIAVNRGDDMVTRVSEGVGKGAGQSLIILGVSFLIFWRPGL
jgi:hypothetical protein